MSSPKACTRYVEVSSDGLRLGGDVVPLLSGEFHYFHHDPSIWPAVLDELCELGLTFVSSYVPWGKHELGQGVFDFGDRRSSLDVFRFLELAGQRGLKVILRPGPHINAELTWLGLPRRVLASHRMLARTPEGNPVWLPTIPRPMPAPSYASSQFLDEADRWLEAAGRVMAPAQWPDGPLVAVQLDNEAPLYFRNGPVDQDYHPEAQDAYRELTERRGRPDQVPPSGRIPKRCDAGELLRYLDWVDCKNLIFANALRRMRQALETAGLDKVVFTHNLAQAGELPEVSASTFDAADLVGFDLYHRRSQAALIAKRCRYVAGSSELPFAAELGVGGPWNLPPRSAADSLMQTRSVIAFGFRALNFYMAVDRDRYYGSLLAIRNGRVERSSAAAGTRAVVELFKRCELHRCRLEARVAIVVPRVYPRLSQATWTLGPFVPPSATAMGLELGECTLVDESFGFARPIQAVWGRTLELVEEHLTRGGIPFVVVDGEGAAARLSSLSPDIVIVLCYELIDQPLWRALMGLAADGLDIVVGPELPTSDDEMRSLPEDLVLQLELGGELSIGTGRLRVVRLDDPEVCRSFFEDLEVEERLRSRVRVGEEGVSVTVLCRDSRARVLGLIELEGKARRLELELPPRMCVKTILGAEALDGGLVALEPFGACLIEVDERGEA